MTLYDVKTSTIDVDFTIPAGDFLEFGDVVATVPHGFKVDIWRDGTVFTQDLPDDYLERGTPVQTGMKNIKLRILDPTDIVVTKIGRLDERDKQDIQACIKRFKITKTQIESRAREVTYVGRSENYEINPNHVLRNLSS